MQQRQGSGRGGACYPRAEPPASLRSRVSSLVLSSPRRAFAPAHHRRSKWWEACLSWETGTASAHPVRRAAQGLRSCSRRLPFCQGLPHRVPHGCAPVLAAPRFSPPASPCCRTAPRPAAAMTWTEGDQWLLSVQLPAGHHQFKVVQAQSDAAGYNWEGGPNRELSVRRDGLRRGRRRAVSWGCHAHQPDDVWGAGGPAGAPTTVTTLLVPLQTPVLAGAPARGGGARRLHRGLRVGQHGQQPGDPARRRTRDGRGPVRSVLFPRSTLSSWQPGSVVNVDTVGRIRGKECALRPGALATACSRLRSHAPHVLPRR